MSPHGGVVFWESHIKCVWTTMRTNFDASRTMENVKTNYLNVRVGVSDGGVALEYGNTIT
jgi:hypothetical protein